MDAFTTQPPKWESAIWEELSQMDRLQRYLATTRWIPYTNTELLRMLRNYRRVQVVMIVEGGLDVTELAESAGTRRGTIQRMLEEGRRLIREADGTVPGI